MVGLLSDFDADLAAPFGVAARSSAVTKSTLSTWNPSDSGGYALLFSNALAMLSNSVANGSTDIGIRGTKSVSANSGKFYFELTPAGPPLSPSPLGMGFASPAAALSGRYPGQDANSCGYGNGGLRNGSSFSAVGGPIVGTLVNGFAYDTVLNVFYVSLGGTWFLSADPTKNTGGMAGIASAQIFPFITGRNAGEGFILNTGQQPFAFGPPAGFQPWG